MPSAEEVYQSVLPSTVWPWWKQYSVLLKTASAGQLVMPKGVIDWSATHWAPSGEEVYQSWPASLPEPL